MNKIFKKRLTSHLVEMAKYLKYVLNDFFVIALMFFIGGLGLAYSNALKTLTPGQTWEKLLAVVIIWLMLQVGGLATFVKNADKVFLSPREYQFASFFNYAFFYSYFMAAIIQLLTWFVLLPFLSVSFGWKMPELLAVLLLMLLLKFGWMALQLTKLFYGTHINAVSSSIIDWGIPLLILAGTFYWNLWGGVVLSLIFAAALFYLALNDEKHLLNWEATISKEETRMNRIYHFFSLFTDVPFLTGKVHRRRYLDPMLNSIKQNQNHLYSNMFIRALLRDSGPSGLLFRLVVIGVILIVPINNGIIASLISVIFIYLIGFQLVPFFSHFDDNVFVHIYPVGEGVKLKNFRVIIQWLLLVCCLLFFLAMILSGKSWTVSVVSLLIWLVESYLLTGPYLKRKFIKVEME